MKPITISCDDGTRLVILATVIGPLAVHRRRDSEGIEYPDSTVTHIATGLRIVNGLSRARAIRIAKALQFLDWNFRSPKSRKVKAMASKVGWAISCTT